MTTRRFEEHVLPHLIHAACTVAVLVISTKILCTAHRIHKGVKRIEEGHREMIEGRNEILGRKEEHGKRK